MCRYERCDACSIKGIKMNLEERIAWLNAWLVAWPEWVFWCVQLMFVFSLGCLLMGFISQKKIAKIKTYYKQKNENATSTRSRETDISGSREFRLQAIAFDLKKGVKDLINSQYVLYDKEKYHSIMQTPLRQNIHHLRNIAQRIVHESHRDRFNVYEPQHLEQASFQSRGIETAINGVLVEQCSMNTLALLLRQDLHDMAKLYPENSFSFDFDIPREGELPVALPWIIEASKEILVNAIKHNSSGVHITVVVKQENEYFYIRVQDNGIGLPASVTDICKHDDLGIYRRASDYADLINLRVINSKLKKVGALFDIRSARRFGTTITMILPIVSTLSLLKTNTVSRTNYNSVECINEKVSLNDTISERQNKLANKQSCAQQLTLITNNSLLRQRVSVNLSEAYNIVCFTTLEAAITAPTNAKSQCLIIDTDLTAGQAKNKGFLLQSYSKKIDIPVLILGSSCEHTAMLGNTVTAPVFLLEKPIIPELLRKSVANLLAQKEKLNLYVEETLVNAVAENIELGAYEHSEQKLFLNRFIVVLEENYSDESFSRPEASKYMSMSEKTLARKITKYTHMNFTEYLKKYRLNKAKQKILEGEKVTFVAFDTGFSSPSYFTQCFRAEFGFAPSMLAKKVG